MFIEVAKMLSDISLFLIGMSAVIIIFGLLGIREEETSLWYVIQVIPRSEDGVHWLDFQPVTECNATHWIHRSPDGTIPRFADHEAAQTFADLLQNFYFDTASWPLTGLL